MDKIKEAFQKVREDINFIYNQLETFRTELKNTTEQILKIYEILQDLKKVTIQHEHLPTPTHPENSTMYIIENPTNQPPLRGYKGQNPPLSTGSKGVPTDRQTNQQTDRSIPLKEKTEQNSIDDAVKILESLDDLKKEIRLKFKRLTDQEILVFSTLYQLEEEKGYTDYKTISERLGLTESSIRDYIGKLIKKGIPIEKKRINNKIISLSVSENLKKIATLSTILLLRDL